VCKLCTAYSVLYIFSAVPPHSRILNASRACNECSGTSSARKSLSAKMESEITPRRHSVQPWISLCIVCPPCHFRTISVPDVYFIFYFFYFLLFSVPFVCNVTVAPSAHAAAASRGRYTVILWHLAWIVNTCTRRPIGWEKSSS